MTGVIAAIIAGGQGTRLGGRRKGEIVVGGRTILERQLAVLRPLFPRVLLVANDPDTARPADVEVIRDQRPGEGPLAGIEVALAALAPGEGSAVCVAGDMPLLQAPALVLLRDHAPHADAVVPEVRGHLEPLLSRYGRACAPAIAAALSAGRRKTTGFLADVRLEVISESALRAVDPELLSLENVNTESDLQRMETLIRPPRPAPAGRG